MENTVKTDVLVIGAGPSGLSAAIHLADLLKKKNIDKQILVVDKGQEIGSHILSGAVIRPQALLDLLPDIDIKDIPFDSKVAGDDIYFLTKRGSIKMPFDPPHMGNDGNYVTSLGEICRFLAQKAVEKGVQIYSGFSMSEILYDKDGKVCGSKCIDTGMDKEGNKLENYVEGTSVLADITIFAEGTRGSLAKKLIAKKQLDKDSNPQIYSLGVKEIFSVPDKTIKPGQVYHTMGFPASDDNVFGGGFIYGLKGNKIAIGLVLGLGYSDPTYDIFRAFQIWKTHPFVEKFVKEGKILEYGAKTLPEGGYYSLIQCYTDNAMIVGDSAGFLAMPALKGVHLAVYSGMDAAKTACMAFEKNDFSQKTLSEFGRLVKNGNPYKELYKCRNFRQAFDKGIILGGLQFGTQLITGGAGLLGRLNSHDDSSNTKTIKDAPKPLFIDKFKDISLDKPYHFSKVDDVFYSGTHHDEEQPVHLVVDDWEQYSKINIDKYEAPCQHYCPAEVYELHTDKLTGKKELRIHSENCVHCKTCDIKEPKGAITWNVPNGGNGPDYKYM